MNSRSHLQPFLNNSLSIRQEIQRFESVHPSIYAIYDLIDLVPDGLVAQQIRDHVVCIEDSFVNSQEWTLSRSVPDLRLGIVGSLSSGKSALVHRYLTGSYMQEESPEGGRFKKEILVDNQSHLLLIRDEGGPPELQFTAWVDAVIFVFSLENESSFNAIYNYYTKMSHFRNPAEIPLILVGTQDAISENNPRVIDDARARKLAADLKRCSYYETCATYGLNVERVFQDACSRIVQQRVLLAHPATGLTPTNSRPSTPNFNPANRHPSVTLNGYATAASVLGTPATQQQQQHMSPGHVVQQQNNHCTLQMSQKDSSGANNLCNNMSSRQIHTLSSSTHHLHRNNSTEPTKDNSATYLRADDRCWMSSQSTIASQNSSTNQPNMSQNIHQITENNNVAKFAAPLAVNISTDNNGVSNKDSSKDVPTPSSTPTTSRKSRRRSNLFTPSKKGDDKLKNGADIGSGRAIPIKQGHLYKRSSKVYRDWKKKYVTLCDNGVLTYHASLHDYMDDAPGKRIPLHCVTVKIPGRRQPKGSKAIAGGKDGVGQGGLSEGMGGLTIGSKDKRLTEKVLLTAYDIVKEPGVKYSQASGDEGMVLSNSNSFLNGDSIKTTTNTDTSNIKKRHRRMKSSGVKNSEYDDPDEYEFQIVSLDNKQWHFEASSSEERDEWVTAIEQQILISLQLNESSKAKKQNNPAEAANIQAIRTRVPGNGFCVDCEAPNPDWASLNLGVLMCIECSGIHRNLGSHISRVRSLDLDEWPPGHLAVMLALGNHLSNTIYAHSLPPNVQPSAQSPRSIKEHFIQRKYLHRDFVNPQLTATNGQGQTLTPGQQLVDAVCAGDVERIVGVLVRVGGTEEVNEMVGRGDKRTALHLACAMGGLAVVQLLIWHNANINAVDQDGRTCLVYARAAAGMAAAKYDHAPTEQHTQAVASSRHLVELLQSHGCPDSGASLIPPGGSSSGTLPRRRATGSISSVSNGSSTGIGNGTIVTSSVI